MSDETVTERVARGAAWLDENEPGWERRIDLATLDLAYPCRCVLGQLHGSYWSYSTTVIRKRGISFSWGDWAYEHGFTRDFNRSDEDWPDLDETWIALIKDRFDTGALSDEVAP